MVLLFHFHFHDSHKNDAHFSPQHDICIPKKFITKLVALRWFFFIKLLFTLGKFVVLLLDKFKKQLIHSQKENTVPIFRICVYRKFVLVDVSIVNSVRILFWVKSFSCVHFNVVNNIKVSVKQREAMLQTRDTLLQSKINISTLLSKMFAYTNFVWIEYSIQIIHGHVS